MNTQYHTTTRLGNILLVLLLCTMPACNVRAQETEPVEQITSPPEEAIPEAPTAMFQPPPQPTRMGNDTWTAIGPWVNITDIVFNPKLPSTIYAGTDGGIFKSTDGGVSWNAINSGFPEQWDRHVLDLEIDPVTPRTIYAGTWNGIFKSTDGGNFWSSVNNGITYTPIIDLEIDPATPSTLYAVTIAGQIFKSLDGGESWAPLAEDIFEEQYAIFLTIDLINSNNLYVGTQHGGIFKSTDAGENWSAINNGLGETYDNPVYELVFNPVTPTTLFALTRTKSIFKSVNSGQDWSALDVGFDTKSVNIQHLLIDPVTPETMYISTFLYGVFKSTDGGRYWLRLDNALNGYGINALAFDPSSSDILYVGTYGNGIMTNQTNRPFSAVRMPTLTAAPIAPTYDPLLTFSAPTENVSVPTPIAPAVHPLPRLDAPFTISGTLDFHKQIQIPANARVIVVWTVLSASPDNGYIFGEGTLNLADNKFQIDFYEPPPTEALNWIGSSALGVGTLIITTDQTLTTGEFWDDSLANTYILGASGQYSIIYVNGEFEALVEMSWFNDFNQGYSAGKGIKIPGTFSEGFEPVDPTTIEVIIDDLDNIKFVNWA